MAPHSRPQRVTSSDPAVEDLVASVKISQLRAERDALNRLIAKTESANTLPATANEWLIRRRDQIENELINLVRERRRGRRLEAVER